MKAPSKLLQIAMTSPVAFIWVPSLREAVVEFVKRPLRNLADDVVKGWFVRSVGLARYGVDDFIQVVAQSNLGSKLGDRVASCF